MIKIFFYFIVMIMPSLIMIILHQDQIIAFIFNLALAAILLLLIRNTKNLIFLTPFFLIAPFAIYYAIYYDSPIDEFVLSVAFDTNMAEIKSFFGDSLYGLVIIYGFWIALLAYLFIIKRLVWNVEFWGKSEHRLFLVVIIFGLFGSGFFLSKKEKTEYEGMIKTSFPLGFALNAYDFSIEMRKMQKAQSQIRGFNFGAKQKQINEKQVVVLVIGETGRRDHWQLNGYKRDTTPLLAKRTDILNAPDMLSLAPATLISIPMMITRKPESMLYKYYFNEPSVLKAFKEVGFKTYWISTQQEVSSFDSLTSAYAKDADEVRFFNHTVSKVERDMDDVLIPELKKILGQPDQKQLIVIHTLGSHQQYNRRNPESFNKFKPSLDDIDEYNPQSVKFKEYSVNSYDNSVLFTDYVLNAFIEQIKAKNALSLMLYAADHGEDLFDGKCAKSGHGNSTVYNFRVPAFLWVSDKYKEKYPDRYDSLKDNISRKINHTSIFPTLVDGMGINIPNYSADRSLAKDLQPYKRLVLKQIDYDKTKPVGKCLELDNLH